MRGSFCERLAGVGLEHARDAGGSRDNPARRSRRFPARAADRLVKDRAARNGAGTRARSRVREALHPSRHSRGALSGDNATASEVDRAPAAVSPQSSAFRDDECAPTAGVEPSFDDQRGRTSCLRRLRVRIVLALGRARVRIFSVHRAPGNIGLAASGRSHLAAWSPCAGSGPAPLELALAHRNRRPSTHFRAHLLPLRHPLGPKPGWLVTNELSRLRWRLHGL